MIDAEPTLPPAGDDGIARMFGRLTALHGAAAAVGFLGQLVVARSLGADAYGEYALLFSYSSIFSLCATFGLDIVMTRVSALHHVAASHDAAGSLGVAAPLLLTVLLGLLGGAILFGFLVVTGQAAGRTAASVIAALLVPLMSTANVTYGILTGLSRPAIAIVSTFLLRESCMLGLTVVVIISGHATGASTPLLGACVGSAVGLLVSARTLISHPIVRLSDAARGCFTDTAPFLVAAAPVAGYTILYLLLNRLDLLLGVYFVEADSFGAYALAARCADSLMLLQMAANSSCGPRIAGMYHSENFRGIEALGIRVGRLLLLIGMIGGVPLFLLTPEFLSIFGDEFTQGASALQILFAGKLFVLSFGTPILVHLMTGMSRRMLVIVGLAIIVSLILIPVLAGRLGLAGVALATALSLGLMVSAAALSLWQAFGVRSNALFRSEALMPTKAGDGAADPTASPQLVGTYRYDHNTAEAAANYEASHEQGYYAALWRVAERPMIDDTLRSLAAGGARRYLDFACGTGRIAVIAEDAFPDCTAIDVSAPMLEIARHKLRRTKVICQDIREADSIGSGFDVVTAFRFFLTANSELRCTVLAALSQKIRPGGYLLTNIHDNPGSPIGIAHRVCNFITRRDIYSVMSFSEYKQLLSKHGFEVMWVQWYGLLPRLGQLFGFGYEWAVPKVEARVTRLPEAIQRRSQLFAVLARRRTNSDGPSIEAVGTRAAVAP